MTFRARANRVLERLGRTAALLIPALSSVRDKLAAALTEEIISQRVSELAATDRWIKKITERKIYNVGS